MNRQVEPVDELLEQMLGRVRSALAARGRADPVMVGIRTGGVWIAERLRAGLGIAEGLGTLNINFYRDDFTRIGMHPRVEPSELPFEVDDRHIVLVDDVLHTGRTIRAALNELFDYGRPRSVLLVTLVERPGRELPIQADICGQHLDLRRDEYVKLIGPDPLELVVQRSA